MKLNKLFILGGLVAASMSLGSCVGDLDLLPTSPNDITPGTFAEDPEGYMRQAMADIYLNVATYGYGTNNDGSNILGSMDGGMSTFQRGVFNLEEVPTDEACWLPAADAIPWTFQFGEVTISDPVVMGVYSRLQVISSLCNQFIQTDFQLKTAEQEALREEFVRQAKIVRSLMYFYLISNYGNVPYNDENVLIGEIAPQLSKDFATGRRLVTEAVVNTLEEIVAWYKANDPNNKPPYGYVGLDAAEALLVKFYLNYGVFTGTPAWEKCCEHAAAVIARRGNGGFEGSGLCENYFQNFGSNNGTQNELLWVIPNRQPTDANGNKGLKSYANGGFMLMAWIGSDDDRKIDIQKDYNAGTGWKCMVARTQLSRVFEWNDRDCTTSNDVRVRYWKTKAHGFNIDNPELTFASWGNNGYLPVKFVNFDITADGSEVKVNGATDPVLIDYGMIRLAEIYLSYAEAAQNGGGDKSKALDYVNLIRRRAGLYDFSVLTVDELRNERQRELYTECVRRTDLVRYGLWLDGYNWNWKYHSAEGRAFPDRFIVYPLPHTVVVTNGYEQYEPYK